MAVGLLYKNGYFHQYLDQNGWQQEEYPEVDLFHLPVERVRDESGEGLEISVTGPEGEIRAVAWQVNVGCVSLILLDTNLQENPPFARELTRRLYPGETRIRLAQEVLLGVGGMRALKAMGVFPHVCHLNEGHCAFVGLERLAQLMEKYQMDVDTAIQVAARTAVFTTHTPVAAGHDEFPAGMIFPCLHPFEKRLGVDVRTILSWGQAPGAPADAPLSMFIFGLKFARECNGVSALHGQVGPEHVGPFVARLAQGRNPHFPRDQRHPHSILDFH